MDGTSRASGAPSTVAVVLALVGAAAFLVAKTVGPVQHVIDEGVYTSTLARMRSGMGYYPAMRMSLDHFGVTASQVRSIRPASLYVVLRYLPPSTYRWLAAAVSAISVGLAWRLVRETSRWVQAVVILGVAGWTGAMLQASYLFTETWTLPLLLRALLAVKRDRWTAAAALVCIAALTRELCAPALLAGLLVAPTDRRRPWFAATGISVAMGAVHYWLASHQLAAHGHEAGFSAGSNLGFTLRFMLSPTHYVLPGILMTLLTAAGIVGLFRGQRVDGAARFAFLVWLMLAMATLYAGRQYWPILFSPLAVVSVGWVLPSRIRAEGVDMVESPRPTRASLVGSSRAS